MPHKNDFSVQCAGAAYLFSQAGASWGQVDYLKSAKSIVNGRYGQNVSLSGNGGTLLIGAPGENAAYVYE